MSYAYVKSFLPNDKNCRNLNEFLLVFLLKLQNFFVKIMHMLSPFTFQEVLAFLTDQMRKLKTMHMLSPFTFQAVLACLTAQLPSLTKPDTAVLGFLKTNLKTL